MKAAFFTVINELYARWKLNEGHMMVYKVCPDTGMTDVTSSARHNRELTKDEKVALIGNIMIFATASLVFKGISMFLSD